VRRRAPACALVLAVLLGGCGGGPGKHTGRKEKPRGEEAERADQLKKIPDGDRVAFYQLGTTIGLLRERAAAGARGTPVRPSLDAELSAAAPRVRALRPSDGRLTVVRDRLESALAHRPDARSSRSEARAALAASGALIASLQRYARTRPEYQALVPD
jgi:hypothetical protein